MPKDTRPWIKVSVDMWRHPKITALTMNQRWALIGLWSLAMEYQTDGVVTLDAARTAGIRTHVIRGIVDAELATYLDANDRPIIDDSSTNGPSMVDQSSTNQRPMSVQLHDYLSHQLSKAELERRTDQRRSAGRKGGRAKAAKRSGPLPAERSGPLSDTRGHARAAEVEEEKEHLPPNSDDDRYVPRERESSSTFSDGTPIPPEPPADDMPRRRGNLALAYDAEIIPIEIGTAARPTTARTQPVHRTTVRAVLGAAGYPRTTIDQLAVQVSKLAGKHPPELITEALREWDRRPNVKPSYLGSVLGDVVKAHRAQPTTPRSTTDERMAAAQALKSTPPTPNRRTLE